MNTNSQSPVEKAQQVATQAHEGQLRKISGQPAIGHSMAVAELVNKYESDETTVAAALLHDVLEDAPHVYSRQAMLKDFGGAVVALVDYVSEEKETADGAKIPWIDRKKAYIEKISRAPEEALLISLADKVDNLGSLLDDYAKHGAKTWASFNASPAQQYWYYDTLNGIFTERLGAEHPLVRQLTQMQDHLSEILPNQQDVDTQGYL